MHGKLGLALVVCLSRIASAHAADVSEFLTGTVAPGTTDKLGIFGPAGADLSGLPIAVYFNYAPDHLVKSNGDSYTTPYYSKGSSPTYNAGLKNPNTAPSVLVIVTLNGKTLTYAPTSVGYVSITNFDLDNHVVHSVELSTHDGVGQPYIGINVDYSNNVTFGQQLVGNPPVAGYSNRINVASQPDNYIETIDFSVTKTAR